MANLASDMELKSAWKPECLAVYFVHEKDVLFQ